MSNYITRPIVAGGAAALFSLGSLGLSAESLASVPTPPVANAGATVCTEPQPSPFHGLDKAAMITGGFGALMGFGMAAFALRRAQNLQVERDQLLANYEAQKTYSTELIGDKNKKSEHIESLTYETRRLRQFCEFTAHAHTTLYAFETWLDQISEIKSEDEAASLCKCFTYLSGLPQAMDEFRNLESDIGFLQGNEICKNLYDRTEAMRETCLKLAIPHMRSMLPSATEARLKQELLHSNLKGLETSVRTNHQRIDKNEIVLINAEIDETMIVQRQILAQLETYQHTVLIDLAPRDRINKDEINTAATELRASLTKRYETHNSILQPKPPTDVKPYDDFFGIRLWMETLTRKLDSALRITRSTETHEVNCTLDTFLRDTPTNNTLHSFVNGSDVTRSKSNHNSDRIVDSVVENPRNCWTLYEGSEVIFCIDANTMYVVPGDDNTLIVHEEKTAPNGESLRLKHRFTWKV